MTAPRVCKRCGQLLSDEQIEVALTRTQRRMYRALLRSEDGLTCADLLDQIYADDPDGGPLESNIVGVMACRMRRAIAPFGLTITANGGRGSRYRLEKL